MPRERCGYTHEARRHQDLGSVCCWRPVWQETGRCVWHAQEAGKSRLDLLDRSTAPGCRLDGARLQAANLDETDCLAGTVLVDADGTDATMEGTDLGDADLRNATLTDASLRDADLGGANLEDADLRDADLNGANLVDARLHEVDLGRSYIGGETAFGDRVVYDREVSDAAGDTEREAAFDAATWTYRTLQFRCRDNALIDRTMEYFIREKDLRRRYAWLNGDYFHAVRAEGSRLLTGYGYSIHGILAVSVLVIFLFALVYPVVGGVQESVGDTTQLYVFGWPTATSIGDLATTLGKSLYLSLYAFTTLGIGDVSPGSLAGQLLVAVEALVGYVLLALFISVLARRRYWL